MILMEGSFIDESIDISRVEADRALRAYKIMNSVIRSSQDYGRHFGDEENVDETALLAQMFSLRSLVLSVENARERMFLYHYYIKGNTLNTCAKLLGVSLRTVGRIKLDALSSVARKMKTKNNV
jgi:DNA-directed RNA polymerase specialized sigma subunit